MTRSSRSQPDDLFDRLAGAYERGQLVPFIGAGMSRPACASWAELVVALESVAGIQGPRQPVDSPEDLVRRAHFASRRLRRRSRAAFLEGIQKALRGKNKVTPPQTAALAQVWWPLVITTNYDNHFEHAYRHAQFPHAHDIRLLGRSALDCHAVLTSLYSPSPTVLWAVQGYSYWPKAVFTTRHSDAIDWQAPALETEIVIGHAEYQNALYREPHFRRAFGEVYRQRSLLFLGTALRDPYFLTLLEENQELYGAGPLPHFALLHKDDPADDVFVRERLQIEVARYESHADLPGILNRLGANFERQGLRATAWDWGLQSGDATDTLRVRITHSPAECDGAHPTLLWHDIMREKTSGLIRRIRKLAPHPPGRVEVDDIGAGLERTHVKTKEGSSTALHVWVAKVLSWFDFPEVYDQVTEWLANCRQAGDTDATVIIGSRMSLAAGLAVVNQVLLAAGEFHQSEMGTESLNLTIHVPEMIRRELASGRLDASRMLFGGQMGYWAVVYDREEGVHERQLLFASPHERIRSTYENLQLNPKQWEHSVHWLGMESSSTDLTLTLAETGVLANGAVYFTRKKANR